jgi:hypothetical protein
MGKWDALICLSPYIVFWGLVFVNAIFGFVKEGKEGVDYD